MHRVASTCGIHVASAHLTYLNPSDMMLSMKPGSIRTSIDIPRELHRRLREAVAHRGCSARQLILASMERALEEPAPARPQRRLRLDPPLIPPRGRRIDLTNERLYKLIELP
jgi:hypothetical protein